MIFLEIGMGLRVLDTVKEGNLGLKMLMKNLGIKA
jgi:hypothetical protein